MENDLMKKKLEEFFSDADLATEYIVDVRGEKISVPLNYKDASALMVFFKASSSLVKKFLFSHRIKPIPIWFDSCLFGITFFDYRDCPAGPYHEFTFSVPVQVDSKLNMPIMPLIIDSWFPNLGYYVTLMGADTDMGMEHIKKIFPYPIYENKIDIQLEERGAKLFAAISEDRNRVITVEVERPANFRPSVKFFNTLYAHEGVLYNVRLKTASFSKLFLMKNAQVHFGDHNLSSFFKQIGVKANPLFGIYYKQATEIAAGPRPL